MTEKSDWKQLYSDYFEKKADLIRKAIPHGSTKGSLLEKMIFNLVRKHLKPKYTIGTGLIADCSGGISNQLDIIIADCNIAPVLFKEDGISIFPIESVLAIVEVSTQGSITKVKEDYEKYKSVTLLTENDQRAVTEPRSGLKVPPKFILFYLDGPKAEKQFKENLRQAVTDLNEEEGTLLTHCMTVLKKKSIYIPQAYGGMKPDKIQTIDNGGKTLFVFIALLNYFVDSFAAQKSKIPDNLTPTIIPCYVWGDQFYNKLYGEGELPEQV